jgi:hypothetical protein
LQISLVKTIWILDCEKAKLLEIVTIGVDGCREQAHNSWKNDSEQVSQRISNSSLKLLFFAVIVI